MGYAKVIYKKEKRRKSIEKMDKCSRYLKQWVLRCPPKKREMNKIAHAFVQIFLSFKTKICFKEYSRFRLATKNIHTHAHLDLIV